MKFSVIVPIYKVEKYLPECVSSILNQDYEDFELILVVDGSPDKSNCLCDNNIRLDARVIELSKQNGGLVSARKYGALISSGAYIICIDGDDKIGQSYFRCANNLIVNYSPDFVCFDICLITPNKNITLSNSLNKGLYSNEKLKVIYDSFVYDSNNLDLNLGSMLFPLFAKVFERSLYLQCQCSIPDDLVISEDLLCSLKAIHAANKIYVSDKCFYYYNENPDSIIRSFDTKKLMKYVYSIDLQKQSKLLSNQAVSSFALNTLSYYFKQNSKFFKKYIDYYHFIKSDLCFRYIRYEALKFNPNKLSFKAKIKYYMIKYNFWFGIYHFYRVISIMEK